MPLIEGESLRAALEHEKKFTAREVMRILHDVVDALAFAHARGVIHRDIKPANILTQGSHALVADFGVAKALSAAMPISGVTTAGIAIGTPAYMAPEQLAGDPNADHRMDIYAVGLLAYELVTGVSPFTGPSPRETLAAQLSHNPKPLHELSAEVPRTLSTLIMRCLAKDPAGRPKNADEILRELDAMTMPLGVTPQGGAGEAPVAKSSSQNGDRRGCDPRRCARGGRLRRDARAGEFRRARTAESCDKHHNDSVNNVEGRQQHESPAECGARGTVDAGDHSRIRFVSPKRSQNVSPPRNCAIPSRRRSSRSRRSAG